MLRVGVLVIVLPVVALVGCGGGGSGMGGGGGDDFQLVFESNRDGNMEIYSMGADGSSVVNLSNSIGSSDRNPDWSYDGATILFDSDRDGNSEIYSMNADGSNVVRLADSSSSDGRIFSTTSPNSVTGGRPDGVAGTNSNLLGMILLRQFR